MTFDKGPIPFLVLPLFVYLHSHIQSLDCPTDWLPLVYARALSLFSTTIFGASGFLAQPLIALWPLAHGLGTHLSFVSTLEASCLGYILYQTTGCLCFWFKFLE